MINIAVVGSGSAGPGAAALLARQGHRVTLFEKAPKMLPVGAGFMLQPSGMEVLKKLGCEEKVLSSTERIDSLYCKNTSGHVLLDLYYEDVKDGLYGCGTQRSALLDILIEVCIKSGVSIQMGCDVTSISKKKDKREVRSADTSYGDYDLVLICNGARSELRSQLQIKQSVKTYPWGAFWFIGKRTEEFSKNQLWQVVEKTNVLNGFLPTGTSEDLLTLFYSLELSKKDAFYATPLSEWKESIVRTAPKAEPFLEQIESYEQLQVAKYNDVVLSRWHDDQVAVLGDAAHALSPQLGQGVNLALQDADALADAIAKYSNLKDALAAYSSNRKRQVKFYQLATRTLTPFFQSNYPALALFRDFGFPIATKSKWIRDQMTLSMAGYKTGIFTSKNF